MQKEVESQHNSPTKTGPGIRQDCRGNAAWAAFSRPGSGGWPRALARGFSWSVHLSVVFWKLHPGSESLDLDITWEASYLDPKSFLHEFVILNSPSLAFILIPQVFRVEYKSILSSSLIFATLDLVYLQF